MFVLSLNQKMKLLTFLPLFVIYVQGQYLMLKKGEINVDQIIANTSNITTTYCIMKCKKRQECDIIGTTENPEKHDLIHCYLMKKKFCYTPEKKTKKEMYCVDIKDQTFDVNSPCCRLPINGGYSQWSSYSICSVTCGGGIKVRTRTCDNPLPTYRGKECCDLGPKKEIMQCNTDPCAVDGGYSLWSSYSTCGVTCGEGTKKRTRTCNNPLPKYGGKGCEVLGPQQETLHCLLPPCKVNGGYSPWSSFQKCDCACNGGKKIRTRNCNNPSPSNGGKTCDEIGPSKETETCNTNSCSAMVSRVHTSCGGYLDLNHRIVYPSQGVYSNHEDCTWRFTTSTTACLSFTRFDLEQGPDYVKIVENGVEVDHFTGNVLPPKTTVNGDIKVIFHTDHSVLKAGFSLYIVEW